MQIPTKNITVGLIVLTTAYSLYAKNLATTLTAVGLAAIVYAVSKSFVAALVVILLAVFIKDINRLIMPKPEPMGVEAFQARDPVTVQHRLEQVKIAAPLAPKIQNITGVLESASILDNTPLQGMQELANEGVPGASIPASAKARVLIYPPSEATVPVPSESVASVPMDNPYLQTGQDRLAEEVAMALKGTDLYAPDSGSLDGVAAGAGPAF
jgi:hypothetical protein